MSLGLCTCPKMLELNVRLNDHPDDLVQDIYIWYLHWLSYNYYIKILKSFNNCIMYSSTVSGIPYPLELSITR